jgi:hypothetical protein
MALLSLAVDQRPLREKHAPVQLSIFWRKDNASPVLRNFWSLAEQATKRRLFIADTLMRPAWSSVALGLLGGAAVGAIACWDLSRREFC